MSLSSLGSIISQNSFIAEDSPEVHRFIRCCKCLRFTPFIFYINSTNALAASSRSLDPIHNFFCVHCFPKQTSTTNLADRFYRSESLLNNAMFLSLFEGFEYSNPYQSTYRNTDRIIITEDTRVRANFKDILAKPKPLHVKMKHIQNIFPPVHHLPFRKYGSMKEMYQAVLNKYLEIYDSYLDGISGSYNDNVDLMVNRTPLATRLSQRSNVSTNRSTDNVDAAGTSRDQLRNLSNVSSLQNANSQNTPSISTVQFSSQSVSDPSSDLTVPESQQTDLISIDISSQDVAHESDITLPSSESIGNVQVSTSLVGNGTTTRQIHDSQEAGPSGLQQPRAKRSRMEPPMNPAPQEVQSTRKVGVRLPRLQGG